MHIEQEEAGITAHDIMTEPLRLGMPMGHVLQFPESQIDPGCCMQRDTCLMCLLLTRTWPKITKRIGRHTPADDPAYYVCPGLSE